MRASNPFFSILTITRNNLDGLSRTFDSIQSQSFKGYEWVVIDGDSVDGTRSWLEANCCENFSWISEPDEGIYDAMNKGVRFANGQYLLFLNSGDLIASDDVLSIVHDSLAEESVDLLYGDAFEDDGSKKLFKRARSHRWVAYSMFTHHQSIFYHRSIFNEFSYDVSFKFAGDWALTARIVRSGKNVRYISIPICCFEQGGQSQKVENVLRSKRELIRVHNEVVGMPGWQSFLLRSLKESVNAVRRRAPFLYNRLRFK